MGFGEGTSSSLQFQRDGIFSGEVYRVFTGHLVHVNNAHSFLNLFGLVLLGMLSRQLLKPRDWWWGMLICMCAVAAGLLLLDTELQWYRGLSGVLHGMTIILVLNARQLAGLIRGFLLIIISLKIVLEQTGINIWGSELAVNSPIIVNAHLYGVIGGFVAYVMLTATRKKRMFRDQF